MTTWNSSLSAGATSRQRFWSQPNPWASITTGAPGRPVTTTLFRMRTSIPNIVSSMAQQVRARRTSSSPVEVVGAAGDQPVAARAEGADEQAAESGQPGQADHQV